MLPCLSFLTALEKEGTTMTKEAPSKNAEMDTRQGFPVQAILLLVLIGLAVLALILKAVGIV